MDKLFIHIMEYIHIRVCVWNEKKRILLHTTGMTPKHDIEYKNCVQKNTQYRIPFTYDWKAGHTALFKNSGL